MASNSSDLPESDASGNCPLQFSLRTLLIVTTLLAVMLSVVPTLTFACLCFAAGAITLLILIEVLVKLIDYFHRAIALIVGSIFALVETASVSLIVAVDYDKVEGHDTTSQLITTIVFGALSLLCYYIAWLGSNVRANENDVDDGPVNERGSDSKSLVP